MNKKAKYVVKLLTNKKIDLSVVESCTGGMLAQIFTSVNGASKIFKFGVITYSNKSKIKYLKVPSKIIQKYGAVSKECCKIMLIKLSKITKTKLNIATTGVAGPTGGTKLKPIGLVYIGVKNGVKTQIYKCLFKNKKRSLIQKATVKKALNLVLRITK